MAKYTKRIAIRVSKGNLPTAYRPYDDRDYEISPTITTHSYDYTKIGGYVIFDYD